MTNVHERSFTYNHCYNELFTKNLYNLLIQFQANVEGVR